MDYQDEKINLVINKLTKNQFEEAQTSGLIDDKQLYLITDDDPYSNDVYKKSETSSAIQLNVKFNDIYSKSETSSATQLTTKFGDYALTSQIPTVNNGTLTIQRNGTTLTSFSANQSNNITANIQAVTGITMNGSSKGSSGTVDLGTVLTAHQSLAAYATKTYVDSNDNYLSGKIDGKIKTGEYGQTLENSDLSVIKITDDDYGQLVYEERTNPKTLYIISSDVENMYGQRVINVAEPTLSSDAATKNYIDTHLAALEQRLRAYIDQKTTTQIDNILQTRYGS